MPTVSKISGIDMPAGGGGTATDSGVLVDISEFDPLLLSPIASILDADEGVTQSSNLVSSWVDDNNDDDDFVQTTAGSKPTLVAAEHNGQATIRFDGTDDILVLDGEDYYSPSLDHTIFLVAKSSDATQDAHVVGLGGSGASIDDEKDWGSGFYVHAGQWGIKACNNTAGQGEPVNGLNLTQTSTASTSLTLISGKLVTGESVLRINGVTEASSTATINEYSAFVDTSIGASYESDTMELPFDGDICFYLHLNRNMTWPEFEAVEAYLADRYGITLS